MIPDPPDDGATEFVCSDCSRYIIQICGPPPGSRFGLCAACLTIPAWRPVPGRTRNRLVTPAELKQANAGRPHGSRQ
jgi:hypothetical protein